jgi:D-sedoheptulose 7-phosphate isomerase
MSGSALRHLDELTGPLLDLRAEATRLDTWGRRIARTLMAGGRLLAAGNGGSAAQAQHLTAELVGRYREDRPPLSAVALCAETSSLTAIGNDYGVADVFSRQVLAHGRPGDILVVLSTSGRSANVIGAVEAADERQMRTLALTGPGGNPLAAGCDDALCVESDHTPTVQEIHLIAIHLLCAAVDEELEAAGAGAVLGSDRR